MGYRELAFVKSGQVAPSNRGLAIAAIIIGGIGTLLLLAFVGFFVFAAIADTTS